MFGANICHLKNLLLLIILPGLQLECLSVPHIGLHYRRVILLGELHPVATSDFLQGLPHLLL